MKKTEAKAKATKKTVKAIKKPLFVAHLMNCITGEDVALAFIEAKAEAGIAITKEELFEYTFDAVREAWDLDFAALIDAIKIATALYKATAKPKKTPWYKKLLFWKKNK